MDRLPGFRDFYPEPLPVSEAWSAGVRQRIFASWREVARRYGTAVMVEGDALRGKRISAWFGEEPFADVIGSLCAATDAECTVSDTLAILR